MRATRETVDLTPRTGNRFTGASGLTIREVEMLLRTSEKIQKIVNKPNLWGLTKRNLNIILTQIYHVLHEEGRIR